MHTLIRSLLVAALVAVCGQASAQAWPAKPVKLIVSQAVVQKLRGMGIFADGADTPEGFGAFIRSELATWGKVVKEIGLQPE